MAQPLYTIGGNFQWFFGGTYNEDAFVVMFGTLHSEMTLLRLLREWLTDCGWTTALTETGVCTYGRSDAVLKGYHVPRSRYVQRITNCLQHKYITQCT